MVALLGRVLWDGMPELLLVIHVYNMLVQRTYLEPIELFQRILDMYPAAFFVDGEVPKTNFLDRPTEAHWSRIDPRRAPQAAA